MKIKLSEIKVGQRFRVDLGAIDDLAASMKEHGLLQSIGVTPDHELLFGQRRLEAARLLGWESIDARVLDVDALLAERDENTERKDFTASERLAIGRAIEAKIAERRGRPPKGEEKGPHVATYPEVPEAGQRTREHAARLAGFGSRETYRLAGIVVDKGAPELVDAVDKGKVAIRAASKLASLPEEVQRDVLKKTPSHRIGSTAERMLAGSEPAPVTPPPTPKKPSDASSRIVEMYAGGATQAEIAKALGIPPTSVLYSLRKAGVLHKRHMIEGIGDKAREMSDFFAVRAPIYIENVPADALDATIADLRRCAKSINQLISWLNKEAKEK